MLNDFIKLFILLMFKVHLQCDQFSERELKL